MSTDATEFNYITGFTKKRAVAILKANFNNLYCDTKIGLLTRLPTPEIRDPDTDGVIQEALSYQEVPPETDVEVNGEIVKKPNGYERIDLELIEADDDGYIQNANEIHFNEARQDWGRIVGFIIESKFKSVEQANTSTNPNTDNTRYITDNNECFIGALKEAYTPYEDGKLGVPVNKNSIALFRENYIRIGLDHKPPEIKPEGE